MSESPYYPSLLATCVGGLQWGISAAVVATVFVNLYVDYLLATGNYTPNEPIGPGPLPIVVALAVGAVGGGLWVTLRTESRTAETRDTRRRVEFLAVLFGFPLVMLPVLFVWTFLPIPSVVNEFGATVGPVVYGLGGLLFASVLVYRQGFDRLTDWRSYGS